MSLRLTPLKIEPGLVLDETRFKVGQGGYIDVSNMRPANGTMEVVGGWEFLDSTILQGRCRGAFCWRDNDGNTNFAFGTHEKLYVWKGGQLYDITPSDFVVGNEDGFGGGGYGIGTYGTGTYGTPSTGSYFPLTWSFGNYGEWLIANARGQKIWVWRNDTSADAVELAGPSTAHQSVFTSYADQAAFSVDYTRGTGWTFSAANDRAECDGTQVADSDLTRSVTTVALERYRVTITFTRTGGSISAIGAGFEGTASSAASGTVTVVFIATTTSATVGARGDLDFVGTVTSVKVETLAAPQQVMWMDVTPQQQIVAYGCEEEATDIWNPRCVRWCDIPSSLSVGFDDWTSTPSNNAGEFVLTKAGSLVCSRYIGDDALIWTDSEIYIRQYLGEPDQTFRFLPLGMNCGICGPQAVAVLGQRAYWVGTDFQFRTVGVGGEPIIIEGPVSDAFRASIAPSQQEKIYAGTISTHNEVIWFYPHDDDGTECSRYIALSMSAATTGKWYQGGFARTAWVDAGPYQYPVGVGADKYTYIHERGNSDNGAALSGFAETGDIYLSSTSQLMMVRGCRPDIHDQRGKISLTVKASGYPQGDDVTFGPFDVFEGDDRVDFRAQGAALRIRWSGSATDTYARIGNPLFDVTQRGRR